MENKKLGFLASIFIVVSTILGPAMFIIPKICLKVSGPSSIFVWIFSSIPFFFVSLVFADLVYKFPKEGGVYHYALKAFGKDLAFLVGWMELLQVFVSGAALAIAFSEIIFSWIKIPMILTSIVILFLLHYIVYRGLKESEIFTYILAIFLFTTLLLMIVFSIKTIYSNLDKITITSQTTLFRLLYSLYFIFNAYAGWEGITLIADKVKDPKRTLPYAILIGNFIASLFFMTAPVLLTIILYNFGEEFLYSSFIGSFLIFLILIQILGSLFSWILVTPGLIRRMAENEDLPSKLVIEHRKYKTPYIAIWFQFFVMVLLALTNSYKIVLEASNVLYIAMYLIISFAYLKVLESYGSILPKSLAKFSAYISIGIFMFLLLFSTPHDILIALILLIIGYTLYLSKNIFKKKKLIKHLHNIFARLIDLTSDIFIGKEIFEIVDKYLNFDRKVILEYGCSTGKLTLYIAKKCKDCIVYASDISEVELNLLKKKLAKFGIKNVKLLYEKEEGIREGFKEHFDIVISVGVLGYIKDYKKLAKDLKRALKKYGEFLFIEFTNIFRIFEHPRWIEKEFIDELKKEGFEVKVEKIKKKFWDLLVIYGKNVN